MQNILVSKEDIDDFNREVDKYCTKPSIPNSDVEKGSAVIDFWARNTAEFPLIAGIAKKLLCSMAHRWSPLSAAWVKSSTLEAAGWTYLHTLPCRLSATLWLIRV